MNAATHQFKPQKVTAAFRHPTDLLLQVFQARKERNSSYSISAFARDLGVSVSLLSRVLSGVRPMTLKFALQVATALDLKDAESNALILSVLHASSKNAKISRKLRARLENQATALPSTDQTDIYITIELERFRAMAHWHHLAVLNLAALDEFESSPKWVAERLGITLAEARNAIERLVAIGLLSEDSEGKLTRTHRSLFIKTQRSEFAVRKFHQQMIEKASDELRKTSDQDFKRRLINGITFACATNQIELIKEKIDRFQDEILALTESSVTKDEVFQMNVQFFPLTQNKGDSQ